MSEISLSLLNKRIELLEQDRNQWKARALAAAKTATDPDGDKLWPNDAAKALGFHKPGIVVHRFNKGSLQLVQFIVWDINRTQYVLKTWKPEFLKDAED